MRDGQADILVEMEDSHLLPGDVRQRNERLEDFKLRRSGRDDDIGFSAVGDRLASTSAPAWAAARPFSFRVLEIVMFTFEELSHVTSCK